MHSVTVTISGPQGTGKSVLARFLAALCERSGIEWHGLTWDVDARSYNEADYGILRFPKDVLVQIQTKQESPSELSTKPGTWVQYAVRVGDREVKRAIRLTDEDAIAAALRCVTDEGCLDIFSSAHEFVERSDWSRVATWSFALGDLHRLGLPIAVTRLTDEEMANQNRVDATKYTVPYSGGNPEIS